MRPEILYSLFSPVTRVKGVGPRLAKALSRLSPPPEGQAAPLSRDILFHLPVGLIDRRATYPLREAPEGETATFVVTVEMHQPPPARSKRPYKVLCANETGDLTLAFFHAGGDYLKRALPVREKRVVSGRVERFDGHAQMTHPDIIVPLSELESVKKVEPVYPLTAGITNRQLANIIRRILDEAPELPEWIGEAALKRHGWQSWRASLEEAHAPKDAASLENTSPARQRLAYDEALAAQLHLARLRAKMQASPARKLQGTGALKKRLLDRLPFALTEGQQGALRDIEADLASGRRMARMIQGDVGSGKTVVALISALIAIENGAQVAFLAPTELIARQHYDTLSRLCEGLPVSIALLTGSVRGAERARALAGLESGEVSLAVGTHALFQEGVRFQDLALIVVDEQHRFGVAQRMAMSGKGETPHLLQMSATPIPRSLTMMLYGDMDCSLIREKPKGRQPVVTRAVPLSRAGELTERLRQALSRGEKAYWVCPLIEDDAALIETDVAAAEARYRLFQALFGNQAALVHGRMKAEARHEALARFSSGDARLLIATTVVEVGVDVTDATIMVIEQAERFGLSQLHQLRGRVGRGEKPSFAVLLYSDRAGEAALSRLTSLRDTEDGFAIAEADLAIRGGGELLGTRQSGLPRFRFVDLAVHQGLIAEARAEAERSLQENPSLDGALSTLLALYGYPEGVADV